MRLCGVDANIVEVNFEDLPKFKDKIDLSFAKDAYYNRQSHDAERIVLLEEVLERYKNIPLNIDFKNGETDVIEHTNELLKKHNYADKVIWGSFNKSAIDKCKAINPDISRFASRQDFFKTLILYYVGLLPFTEIDYQ